MEDTPSTPEQPVIQCEIIQALEDTWTANIFVICLNKPHSAHNIIDQEFGQQLARVVWTLRERVQREEVDLVVLCSAKDKSFMAGADIEYEMRMIGTTGESKVYEQVRMLQDLLCSLESVQVPTVVILNGTTLGGGLELALACDFRIADSVVCEQIGLPEVKLGVLPGAGGCVRLPRLIGFRHSLPILISGQSVTAKKALRLGLVDQLFPQTQTLPKYQSAGESCDFYEYQWLSGLLACIEQKKIGSKPFLVKTRESGATAVSAVVDTSQNWSMDVMMSSVAENWEECERKAEEKYPKKSGYVRTLFEFLLNTLFFAVTLFQVWRKVGLRLPAPYMCLLTTLRCLYAGSWRQSMSVNAHGMVCLISNAESTALMFLFLITRKLRKLAVRFGLKASENAVSFKQLGCTILVYVSSDLLDLSLPFVQSLLYSGIAVTVVVSDKVTKKSAVSQKIQKLFGYALKRGYILGKEVEEKMKLLCICELAEAARCGQDEDCERVVIVNASTAEFSVEEVSNRFSEVIFATVSPKAVSLMSPYQILMNLGDPLRKNTLTVEITPLTNQTPPKHLRCLSALIVAIGKTPVLTPPTTLTACGLHMLLSHWSLAVSLVSLFSRNITPKLLDKALVSAGYSAGPFQVMKKFGRVYLKEATERENKSVYMTRLRKFIETGKIPASERKRTLSITDQQIANLFTLNLVLTALHARKVTPGLSEAAIDTLCVAGLVQFPPTETGPLNFAVRMGRASLLGMYDDHIKAVPFVSDVNGSKKPHFLLSGDTFLDLFDTKASDEQIQSLVDIFQGQMSDLVLLSRDDLKRVGRTYGVQSRELFLYPFLLSSVVLRVLISMVVLTLLVGLFCLAF